MHAQLMYSNIHVVPRLPATHKDVRILQLRQDVGKVIGGAIRQQHAVCPPAVLRQHGSQALARWLKPAHREPKPRVKR